ncbi:MAG: thiol reductant exporter subunit CydD [Actinomycetota bacterium]
MVALALLGTLGTLLFSFELSAFVARATFANLWLGLLGATVKAISVFGQEWVASISAAKVKAQLRSKLLTRIFAAGSPWHEKQSSAELTILLSSGLDSLDAYFSKFLPQLVYTAIALPVFFGVTLGQDPTSAIIMICTMPLIPLFMVIIGWATQRVQQRQLAGLTAMSTYFGEVVRGLLTLRVFGRAEAAADNLVSMSRRHRKNTMRVLSVSFLSGFALELIASLSVALIAVSIGLRLLNGQIDFRVGLFVLLLAPDAYLPLRMIGANFHASTDGVAAIQKTFDLMEQRFEAPVPIRIAPAQGKFNVLVGESGAGKSTALEALDGADSAWMPQSPMLLPGTIADNIAGFGQIEPALLAEAVRCATLDDVDLNQAVSDLNQALSGGQAQRVALARAVYRGLAQGARTLLLDEPVSAQDKKRAAAIGMNLKHLTGRGFTVVAVSHQDALSKLADRVIEVKR